MSFSLTGSNAAAAADINFNLYVLSSRAILPCDLNTQQKGAVVSAMFFSTAPLHYNTASLCYNTAPMRYNTAPLH